MTRRTVFLAILAIAALAALAGCQPQAQPCYPAGYQQPVIVREYDDD